jgi:hypothetical protein
VKERPSSGRAMTWFRVRWDHEKCHESWQTWRILGAATRLIAARAADHCEGQPGAGGMHELGRGRGGWRVAGRTRRPSWARPSAKRTSCSPTPACEKPKRDEISCALASKLSGDPPPAPENQVARLMAELAATRSRPGTALIALDASTSELTVTGLLSAAPPSNVAARNSK